MLSALERCASLYVEQANASASQKMELSQRRQDQILELRDQLRDLSVGPQNARRQLQAQQVQDQIQDLEHAMRDDIAGITNERGNVVGLMPHPERAVEELTGSGTDVLGFFTSLAAGLRP